MGRTLVFAVISAMGCGLVLGCDGETTIGTDDDGGPAVDARAPVDGGGTGDDGGSTGDDGGPRVDAGGGGDDGGSADPDGGSMVDAGPPPPCTGAADCDDGIACTADSCQPEGCANTLIDGDMDGYASMSLGECGGDCNDMEADANPMQMMYFSSPHGSPGGAPSFDWNCDGRPEPRWTGVGRTCVPDAAAGCTGDGWLMLDGAAPPCGVTGTWRTCVASSGSGGCIPRDAPRTQECR